MTVFNEELLEYYSNYKRIYTEGQEEYKEKLKEWIKKKRRFVLGTFSSTEPKKEKLIQVEHTREVGGIKFTLSELAKSILSTLGGGKKKRGRWFPFRKEAFYAMKDNFAGLYALAGTYEGEWIYLDIKSFYFTLYSRFIGINYQRGGFILLRNQISFTKEQLDFLREDKKLRNTIFGVMRSTSKVEVINGKKQLKEAHNKFLHPQLANFIYDTSKAIAHELITKFGAIYYNTDGAIIPRENYEGAKAFLNELGFNVEIKAHWTEGVIVKAVGSYGGVNPLEFQTLNFERVKLREGYLFTNIDLDVEEVSKLLSFIARF